MQASVDGRSGDDGICIPGEALCVGGLGGFINRQNEGAFKAERVTRRGS